MENVTCANCGKLYRYHIDEKCPFEACTFTPLKEFQTYEEPGIAIGNLAAIKKIKMY